MIRSSSDTPSGKGSSFPLFTRPYRAWLPSMSIRPRIGSGSVTLYTPGAPSGAAALRSIGSAPLIITTPRGSPFRCSSSPEQPLEPAAPGTCGRRARGRLARALLRTAQDPPRPLRIALRLLVELVDVDLGRQRTAAALSRALILMLAALMVRQRRVVTDAAEAGDHSLGPAAAAAVVTRGLAALSYA